MKKTVSLILALMLVLSVCLTGCAAEKAADTGARRPIPCGGKESILLRCRKKLLPFQYL